jgi:hypothetical protein
MTETRNPTMGDSNRIRRILAKVEALWLQNPDLRLGQLVSNVAGGDDRVFYIEDEGANSFEEKLHAYPSGVGPEEQSPLSIAWQLGCHTGWNYALDIDEELPASDPSIDGALSQNPHDPDCWRKTLPDGTRMISPMRPWKDDEDKG